jgi:hypothetical protein
MEDFASGFTMSLGDISQYFCITPEIDASDIYVYENTKVDPADVLEAEVQELQAQIDWDVEKNTKLKAFLETLAA